MYKFYKPYTLKILEKYPEILEEFDKFSIEKDEIELSNNQGYVLIKIESKKSLKIDYNSRTNNLLFDSINELIKDLTNEENECIDKELSEEIFK